MTTPKRNEAVAPVAWIGDFGLHMLRIGGNSKGYTSAYAKQSRSSKHPLYSQQTIDALQGEVSRLREVMARVVNSFERLGEAKGVLSHLEARRDCENSLIQLKEALNLEPPTDGR